MYDLYNLEILLSQGKCLMHKIIYMSGGGASTETTSTSDKTEQTSEGETEVEKELSPDELKGRVASK